MHFVIYNDGVTIAVYLTDIPQKEMNQICQWQIENCGSTYEAASEVMDSDSYFIKVVADTDNDLKSDVLEIIKMAKQFENTIEI